MNFELNPTHLTVRLLRLPRRQTLAAAHDLAAQPFRDLTVIELHVDGDTTSAAGWGECSALNDVGYTSESALGAFNILTSGVAVSVATHPLAFAGLEMAMLDAQLRRDGRSLAEHLGTAGKAAPAGAVVGVDTIESLLAQTAGLADLGYTRVKYKVTPQHLVAPIQAVRVDFPHLELQIDANGSLGANDMAALNKLQQLDVTAVEQPFAPSEIDLARRLVSSTDMSVVADESARSLADVQVLSQMGAATAIAIKPPCLGGIAAAMTVLDAVVELGLDACVGGMLESGLGRHALAALAPLPGFTRGGDLSPAARWLQADPFNDIAIDGSHIQAPDLVGVGGAPDPEVLQQCTQSVKTVPISSSPDVPEPQR